MAKVYGRALTTPPPKKLSKYDNDPKYVTETELDNKGYQNKTDNTLTTDSKQIVGAINEVHNKIASLVDGNGVAY